MMRLHRTCGIYSLAAVLLLLMVACRTEILPIDRPHIFPGVRVQDVSFYSTSLARSMPYRVYLPEEISPGRKLPVVFLLHGAFGNFRDWSNRSMVVTWAARGLILVMVQGDQSSYYMNSVEHPRDRYEDYLLRDLSADVSTRFPAAAGRSNRALVGISMGGFAALSIALRHPEIFCFVAAISPAVDILHRGFSVRHFGQWWRTRNVFGPASDTFRQAVDPFALVQTANPARASFLYVTAGESEPLYGPCRRFARELAARHFAFEFHAKPGGHDWGEWDSQLPGVLATLMAQLRDTQQLHSANDSI
ncbi:MAG: prolyl oligopeptidase family serine peptidase [Acidobacteriota bacterium]|nr:prolyl oligopeptidase family serine peptidase [Acidobacteriota bacterium]